MTSLLMQRHGVDIEPTAVFLHPTVRALASYIEHRIPGVPEALPGKGSPPDRPHRGGRISPPKASPGALTAGSGPFNAQTDYHGAPGDAPATLAFQAFGLFLQCIFDLESGMVPLFMSVVNVLAFCIWPAGVALVVPLITELLLLLVGVPMVIGLKWIFVGRLRPGAYPVWGSLYNRRWLTRRLLRSAEARLLDLFAETPLMPAYHRALGAQVGPRCSISGSISDCDLVSLGADVSIARLAAVEGHVVQRGRLLLHDVCVGDSATIGTFAHVGCSVPPCSRVGNMATAHPNGPGVRERRSAAGIKAYLDDSKAEAAQGASRLVLGVPLLLALRCISLTPALLLAATVVGTPTTTVGAIGAIFAAAWVLQLAAPQCYFVMVLIVKYIVLGFSREGERDPSDWKRFRRWLLERLVSCREFHDALAPWEGTALLNVQYRLLGAKVGRRAHLTPLQTVEHELLEVGADAIVGREVALLTSEPRDSWARHKVRIFPRACVGRTVVIETGAVLKEGASATSGTLVPSRELLPAGSSSVGNVGQHGAITTADFSSVRRRELLQEAMLRHRHAHWYWLFNAWRSVLSLTIRPLPFALTVVFTFVSLLVCNVIAVGVFGDAIPYLSAHALSATSALLWFVIAPLFELLGLAVLFCVALLLRRAALGQRSPRAAGILGSFSYYSAAHARAMVADVACELMRWPLDLLAGTLAMSAAHRALGGTVGRQCCLLAGQPACDGLELGDYVTVGEGARCDTRLDERMVVELGTLSVGRGATLRSRAVALPGCGLGDGATLLERSQLARGIAAPRGTTWAGLPASLAPLDADVEPPSKASDHGGQLFDVPYVKPTVGRVFTKAVAVAELQRSLLQPARSAPPPAGYHQ